MSHFTPLASLLGGLLIGLAAALMWVANGRIAGISGIIGGLRPNAEAPWRLAFLLGLIVAPLLYASGFGPPAVAINAEGWRLVAAGLLVGLGTRLGGGCTSGHGVCGIARLSPRSIAATGVFMAVAAATVFLSRHTMGS